MQKDLKVHLAPPCRRSEWMLEAAQGGTVPVLVAWTHLLTYQT